jgi:glycosyltransferase 2 family protein
VNGVLGALSHAADALTDPFGRLDPRFAVVALAFQAANLVFRAAAWRNVLVAAYPNRRVSLLGVGAAYAAGVALNGFLPARGGEAAKIGLARLQVPGSSVVTITAAGSVVLAFDALVGGTLIIVAWATGALPQAPHAPASISHLTGRPFVVVAVAIALAGAAGLAAKRFARPLRRLVTNLRRGGAVLRTPRRYVQSVVSMQVGAWISRIGAAFFLLAAFGLPASLRLATLVVVLGGLSTLVPATPGGMGTQQLLLVYALHGTIAAATALSFSIGMQVTVTVTNTLIGVIAAMVVFKTVRPLGALAAATRAARG